MAKEQGLRSRAAFKLTQINRQYPTLQKAKAVLDLCAAPGGWTQIAARECGSQCQIIAVDILPIRKLPNRNIQTMVGDITTEQCKADINRAIAGKKVDVVLHDGAPNIGGSYEKDAYEQMELAVHSLRCATQHLKKGGTFITKIYRSRDSASFQWVVQQLFGSVLSFKPKASRQQSAEIFYICQDYYSPDKIDPRLLDPKHIFELVDGDTTGANTGNSGVHVFHKQWDTAKRHRDGYADHLDATLRHVQPIHQFLDLPGRMDAIKLLSKCTAFKFNCDKCHEIKEESKAITCNCNFYLHHPLTTPEIKECIVDLRVLNKGDFKGLMIWRERMLETLKDSEETKVESDDADADDSDDGETGTRPRTKNEEEEEDEVQKEIQQMREKKLREKKKAQKKDRKLAAKKRKQSALGMDLNAIEVQEQDQFFTLKTLKSIKDLEAAAEVNIDQVTDEQVFGIDSNADDDDSDKEVDTNDLEDDKARLFRLEQELDGAYDKFLATTKDGMAKAGTKAAKRSKKLMREKLAQESHQDQEMLLAGKKGMDADSRRYAEMLQGANDSDDLSGNDEENDDDGFDADPMTPEEAAAAAKTKRIKNESNPLIHTLPEEPSAVKTARWFSNPLFASIGQAAESATQGNKAENKHDVEMEEPPSTDDDGSDSDADDESEEQPKSRKNHNAKKRKVESDDENAEEEDETPTRSRNQKKQKKKRAGLDADEVLAMMPKTDKEKRHEKRLKALSRDERRQARKAKKLGESEGDFDLAPAHVDDDDDEDEIDQMAGMTPAKKQKLLEARKLIKAGMGANVEEDKGNGKFEVVEQDRPLPVMDHRKYDSENEEYDSDDYAKTMALGTMMLRRSKAKALVDASYNRFTWNDPEELPEWFVDDENKHYRPQLPVPPALLAKMKEKMLALSSKPIAKVAEARARKNKLKLKLAGAKKKAQAVANSTEMSEAMKLKSISKALRNSDGKNGKEYMVAKKGGGKQGVKGKKMVDKRMKNDKRGMDRASKKQKGAKRGGLTGSKKRRHHS